MHQIGGSPGTEIVSLLLQPLSRSRVRELLPGDDKDNVSAFVAQRHSIGEGKLPGNPTHIDTQGLLCPQAGNIEILTIESFNHLEKLLFRPLARHLSDNPNNSRHRVLSF